MRFTIPSSQVRLVRTDSTTGLRAYVRRVNQNPVYFLVYEGTTIHIGSRRHIARKFNHYAATPGIPLNSFGMQATGN